MLTQWFLAWPLWYMQQAVVQGLVSTTVDMIHCQFQNLLPAHATGTSLSSNLPCCASDMPVSPLDSFLLVSVSLDMQSKAALVAPGMAGCVTGYASGLHMFTRGCASASQLAYLVQGAMLHAVVHTTVQWALAGVDRALRCRKKPPEVPESSTVIEGNADPGFGPSFRKQKAAHCSDNAYI